MRPLSARRKCWLCYPDQSHKVRDRRALAVDVGAQLEDLAWEKEAPHEVAWAMGPHYDDDRHFDSYYQDGAYAWLFRRSALRWYSSRG